MRKNNYDALLYTSITILIVSAVLLAITGYSIYFRNKNNPVSKKNMQYENVATKDWVRDSLQQVYNKTVAVIDEQFSMVGKNSAEAQASDAEYDDMAKLRKEIGDLLKQQGSESSLAAARIKIEELQLKVVKLQQGYSSMQAENKKLQQLLDRLLAAGSSSSSNVVTGNSSNQNTQTEKTVVAEKNTAPTIAGMHLFAVAGETDDQKETNAADDADKLVGSFTIKNWPSAIRSDIMVVVLQPDGRVVKNSGWDSGSFETTNGKKIYSLKMSAEQVSPEKSLNFSISPERIYKGTYILQVWHKGSMIGRMSRTMT